MVVTRLARRLRQQGEASASPTQLAALATIERDGPLTLGALAAIERVRPPTITAAVGRLEERGLVRRRIDAHRRAARVEITPRAGACSRRAAPRKTAYLERQLARLTPMSVFERAAEILERVLEKERS